MKLLQKIFYFFSIIIVVKIKTSLSANDTEEHFARIMGGYRPETFIFAQHIVSLRYGIDLGVYGANHICGGSILSERIILTAAHCVINLQNIKALSVVVGSTDRLRRPNTDQVFKVQKIVTYPVFNARSGYGDLAILHLDGRIREDGVKIQRINLTDQIPKPGQRCVFLGWGGLIFNGPLADELVYMNVTLLPVWHCSLFSPMVKGVVCVGEIFGPQKVAGNGDSGGPLICNGKLVGVASYIVAIRTYFASVYYHREWIAANCKSQLLQNITHLKILSLSLICSWLFNYVFSNCKLLE